MIDWDALMGGPSRQSVPVCPSQNSTCPDQLGQPEPAPSADFGGFVPVVPVVPLKNQGAKEKTPRGGGGVVENRCARNKSSNVMSDDDRIVCSSCQRLNDAGVCEVARPDRGALVVANRGYRPVLMLTRCEGYLPLADDPDQRTGAERWQGLR